jgi:hypothetical protein
VAAGRTMTSRSVRPSEREAEAEGTASPAALSHAEILGTPGQPPSQLEILSTSSTYRGDKPTKPARGMLGTPAWYEDFCETLSSAVWRDQVTELEARWLLDFHYRLMVGEMNAARLWRKPRRGSRGRRPTRVRFRFRRVRCETCRAPVGPFTGICPECHFGDWWPNWRDKWPDWGKAL